LRYPNNILGHIQVSWLDPKKLREIVVVGDKKMMIWDELAPTGPIAVYDKTVVRHENYEDFGQFQLLAREGDITIPKVRVEEPLKVQNRFFLQCLGDGRLPMNDGPFAVDVVKVLEAIEHSLKAGGVPAPVPHWHERARPAGEHPGAGLQRCALPAWVVSVHPGADLSPLRGAHWRRWFER
jgi:predicted dehydrogenase